MTAGEYASALAIDAVVPTLVPKPIGWGQYEEGDSHVYFILSDYHDMSFPPRGPDPSHFAKKLANLHSRGKSPTGKFGFVLPTALGKFERTVTWEKSWAKFFTNQLEDVIRYDNEVNGIWPEYDAACTQLMTKLYHGPWAYCNPMAARSSQR
jgi:protein-ribulosamine 3-kinase